MFGHARTPCNHKTFSDFPERVGEKLKWKCSHCGKSDFWSDSWGYFGSLECTSCCLANMQFVACSADCMKALKEKHNIVDERVKKPKEKAAPRPKRKPAWQVKAEAEGWGPRK